MELKNYLPVDDADRSRFEEVYARYRMLYNTPDQCRPMIIINTPRPPLPVWEKRLADPLIMLQAELDILRPHLEIEDDRVPTVCVQFGTAQIAAAFGCRMHLPENNRPAAGSHVLAHAEDADSLEIPAMDAGWYGKLAEWIELWKQQLPQDIHIQQSDIQSAFNSAHLIRGNDILLDFYDYPNAMNVLLDRVTDFMIAITKHTRAMITEDPEWFFDLGGMWKGAARISNCSMQMISPQLYREHVLPHDIRFFNSIGGGRMHYCGITGDVINDFFKVPSITGLEIDIAHHDFFDLCERAPDRVALTPAVGSFFGPGSSELKRLLAGDWPRKRNIVVVAYASSIEEGKTLLKKLRDSIPYGSV